MVILFFIFLQTKEVLSFFQSRRERKIAIDSPKGWGAHKTVKIKGIHLRKTVSHLFSEKKYETIDLE